MSRPDQLRVLPFAVLRAAAWPIEVADEFAALDLAHEAAGVFEAERRIDARREAVQAALHAAIPSVEDRGARAYLLAIKRHVYGSIEPLPSAEASVPSVPDQALAALIATEATERAALAERRAQFERLHHQRVEQQLRSLRRLTDEPRFQRALLVANSPVAASWMAPDAPRRPKRQRHLETTVFHYLMRACGRPTPNGAWAGVAVLTPSPGGAGADSDLGVRPARARYAITPSLRPFVTLLRTLSHEPRYRWHSPLHLNPTLRSTSSGFRFEQDQAGINRWVNLPSQPLLALIIDAYADARAQSAAPLIDALAVLWPDQPDIRAALQYAVGFLLDRDVLRTGLRLPSAAPDAWTALSRVCETLIESDRETWCAAIDRLHQRCDTLAADFDTLAPRVVEERLREIEAEVRLLWTAVGIEGTPPAPLVHVDMRLPFEVRWTEAAIARATATVRALLTFHAGDGGAEIFRRQTAGDVFAVVGDGAAPAVDVLERLAWPVPPQPRVEQALSDATTFPDTLEFVLGQMPPDSKLGGEARAHCQRWEALLEGVHAQPSCTLPSRPPQPGAQPGPAGAVLLRLAGAGAHWIGPGRPEPALFAARFAALFDDGSLIGALRDALAAGLRSGMKPVEVAGWDAFNPNAGLHPALSLDLLDPHMPGADLRDVCIEADPIHQRLWLRRAGDAHLLVPIYSTGAAIGYHDVCSRLLLVIAAAHGWEFIAFRTPPLRAERMRWKHLPRLLLPDGDVLSPERWTIDRQVLDRLSSARGAARYLAWRDEMHRLGVPELVHARCGPNAPELLVRTDSPLAVRCLLDAYAARAPWFELSELPRNPREWPVQDDHGNHHLAEIAVSWFADDYWSAVDPRGS